MHGIFLKKKTSTVSLSIDVRITVISGVVYLLRIFKMFHGFMNNPVLSQEYNSSHVLFKNQIDVLEIQITFQHLKILRMVT